MPVFRMVTVQTVEAASESAARQCYIDGVCDTSEMISIEETPVSG